MQKRTNIQGGLGADDLTKLLCIYTQILAMKCYHNQITCATFSKPVSIPNSIRSSLPKDSMSDLPFTEWVFLRDILNQGKKKEKRKDRNNSEERCGLRSKLFLNLFWTVFYCSVERNLQCEMIRNTNHLLNTYAKTFTFLFNATLISGKIPNQGFIFHDIVNFA